MHIKRINPRNRKTQIHRKVFLYTCNKSSRNNHCKNSLLTLKYEMKQNKKSPCKELKSKLAALQGRTEISQ